MHVTSFPCLYKGSDIFKAYSICFCSFYEGCLEIVACSVFLHIVISQAVRKLELLGGVYWRRFWGGGDDVWNKMQQRVVSLFSIWSSSVKWCYFFHVAVTPDFLFFLFDVFWKKRESVVTWKHFAFLFLRVA